MLCHHQNISFPKQHSAAQGRPSIKANHLHRSENKQTLFSALLHTGEVMAKYLTNLPRQQMPYGIPQNGQLHRKSDKTTYDFHFLPTDSSREDEGQ